MEADQTGRGRLSRIKPPVWVGAALAGSVALSAALLLASPQEAESAEPVSDDPVLARAREAGEHLNALVNEEQQLQAELKDLDHRSRELSLQLSTQGRTYVRLLRLGLLPVGGGFPALVAHAARLERLRQALRSHLDLYRQANHRRSEISDRLSKLRSQKLNAELEERVVAEARDVLLSAKERQLAFERAFQSGGASGVATVYGASGPADPATLSAGFEAMKGRLPFPIPGRAEIRSSRRADGQGLEMHAPMGSPVRAVYPGRVAFADQYGDYDRTVIVDHGQGYYTVSANLGSIDVHVGEEVSAGSRLGTVGNPGRGWMLYFELRIGAHPVDPAEWFGI